MLLSGYPVDCTTLIQRYGTARARELFAFTLRAVDEVRELIRTGDISCDLTSAEHITAAVHPGHRKWLSREQDSVAEVSGFEPRLLSAEQMSRTVGTNRYWGGLSDPWAAALNPAGFAAGLYRMARNTGVQVYWRVQVQEIEKNQSRPRVRTDQGTVDVDCIVWAGNGYSSCPVSSLHRRIVPVQSMMIATREVPQEVMDTVLPRGNTVSDTQRLLHYFRKSPDGRRLLFGGRPAVCRGSLQAQARALHRDMIALYPQLASYGPEYAWSGQVGFTRDIMPHAGIENGLGYAVGFCGHGIALSTYLGRLVAEGILTREGGHSLLPFPDPSFPIFPLYRKRAWFVPLAVAWYGLLDRLY
jgi:glycine/D-amino acid oxidase-like deaminating enzyme